MRFFEVISADDFRALAGKAEPLETEAVSLEVMAGRYLAQAVVSGENLPALTRSSMDGYAVRAADVFGASESQPAYLELAGELAIDRVSEQELAPGTCVGITTGATLPPGADAVVMVEHTERMADTVEIRKPLAPNENVLLAGEDVTAGQEALPAGVRLRPQEVGLLAALGVTQAAVHRLPRVGVLSTGDELIPAADTPRPGQIRDVNGPAVAAMIAQAGYQAEALGIVPDDLATLVRALNNGLKSCDVVFLSGGSSIGTRDLTVAAIDELEDAELLVHGVQVSPGKPTILARAGAKYVFGLPGQVTSAQVVMHLFGLPLLVRLAGNPRPFETQGLTLQAELARNVASKPGREDHVRVALEDRPGQPPLAHPLLGKSGLLKTLLRAQGLVRIDARQEGLYAGALVDVRGI